MHCLTFMDYRKIFKLVPVEDKIPWQDSSLRPSSWLSGSGRRSQWLQVQTHYSWDDKDWKQVLRTPAVKVSIGLFNQYLSIQLLIDRFRQSIFNLWIYSDWTCVNTGNGVQLLKSMKSIKSKTKTNLSSACMFMLLWLVQLDQDIFTDVCSVISLFYSAILDFKR